MSDQYYIAFRTQSGSARRGTRLFSLSEARNLCEDNNIETGLFHWPELALNDDELQDGTKGGTAVTVPRSKSFER